MRVRFGYVAMSLLVKNCSPSKTVTVKTLSKIEDQEAKQFKLTNLAKTNIKNTQRLLYHNKAYEIKIYRFTSKLIPLATHPITNDWDWEKEVKDELKLMGDFIKKEGFRVSAHPDHFTLLNSPKEEVLESSIKDLEYHNKIFELMEIGKEGKLILHIGGKYGGKKTSIDRFKENFKNLPKYLKERIILENDDKTYTAKEVLEICQDLKVPMVLDIHHHWCNNDGEDIKDYIKDIFSTWDNEDLLPKIHISSPKSEKEFRSHADNININFFIEFLKKAKLIDNDFDVMIEAKNKDKALFNLMENLEKVGEVNIIDGGSIDY